MTQDVDEIAARYEVRTRTPEELEARETENEQRLAGAEAMLCKAHAILREVFGNQGAYDFHMKGLKKREPKKRNGRPQKVRDVEELYTEYVKLPYGKKEPFLIQRAPDFGFKHEAAEDDRRVVEALRKMMNEWRNEEVRWLTGEISGDL